MAFIWPLLQTCCCYKLLQTQLIRWANTQRSAMGRCECCIELTKIIFASIARSLNSKWYVQAIHWCRQSNGPKKVGDQCQQWFRLDIFELIKIVSILFGQIDGTQRIDRQYSDSILWITKAFNASFIFGEPKLPDKFNGTEEFSDYFWTVSGTEWQRNTGRRSQRHEASVPYCWSARFTCKQ